MKWNWQHKDWPHFSFDPAALEKAEEAFKVESAKLIGATSIVSEDQRRTFMIDLMSEEALKSSKIEGEELDRDSVASSLLRQFGFSPEYSDHRANDKEKGMAALMVSNYRTFGAPLTHDMLFDWHKLVVGENGRLRDIGRYRTGGEPMQVVSGYAGNPKVHFEAPPSARIPAEMEAFMTWFNDTAPGGASPLSPLTRAGIAHIYFASIHPFEDGNGRIARALSEKVLAQGIDHPALFAFSYTVERSRSEYYDQLEKSNKGLSIDSWMAYFSDTVLEAIHRSQKIVRFIVEKTRLYDRVRNRLNERQSKALARMFAEGIDGFRGGMSAEKYMRITGAISRTATRDLQQLVEIGALIRTGKLKGTRYWLDLPAD